MIGSGTAAGLAAELAELTKGGERRPGVALMGLGLYSRGELAPAFEHTKLCRFAGVITGSREKGLKWSQHHGFPEKNIWTYESMHEIAGNPDIDIVYVVTPNGLHAEHTVKAAQAGKHVICEKPMANTVAECDAMLSACARSRVQLSIGYRLHYDPFHIELDRLAREKDFGTLNKLSGGGPLMDVGIYVIQAACRAAMAQPIAVTARELPKSRPDLFNEVEETIEWSMEFPGGVTCDASSSYNRNANNFRAEGAKGWIAFDPAYAYRGIEVDTSRGRLAYPQVPQQALHMDDFASCILTGRKTPVSGLMGRDHMVIIEAIYRSAAEGGRRVAIPQA